MQINIIILFAFLCLNLQAQDCTKYNEAMKAGYNYLKTKPPNYDKALIEFQAAQIAAHECGKVTDTPAVELKKVFEGLKAQRDEADSAKKVAVKSAIETKQALNIAKNERLRADSALAKAEKLIHAFYFYDGKFALALKEIGSEKKYGFIDTLGNEVIPYKYDKAEQFDNYTNTGFAKVKMDENGKIIDYLIDTAGEEYRAAYKLADLNKDIIALDLRGEQFDSFPSEILFNTQLQILILSDIRSPYLDSIEKPLIIPKGIQLLQNVKFFDISSNGIESLPSEIGQLKSLETFDLNGNQLNALPPEIGQLKNLQNLNLNSNQLENLPEEIGELNKLQYFTVSDNRPLKALPAGIGKLINLQTLDIKNDGLLELPSEIGRLANLKTLYAHYNFSMMKPLPAEIGQLKNLQTLTLRGNRIGNLPPEIGGLINLQTLDVKVTNLDSMPSEIGQLKNLRTLNLSGNPISESELQRIRSLLPHCAILLNN